MYVYMFLLRMTDTMTSQNNDLSFWDTLYTGRFDYHKKVCIFPVKLHTRSFSIDGGNK
jgi:hypothetical protein